MFEVRCSKYVAPRPVRSETVDDGVGRKGFWEESGLKLDGSLLTSTSARWIIGQLRECVDMSVGYVQGKRCNFKSKVA